MMEIQSPSSPGGMAEGNSPMSSDDDVPTESVTSNEDTDPGDKPVRARTAKRVAARGAVRSKAKPVKKAVVVKAKGKTKPARRAPVKMKAKAKAVVRKASAKSAKKKIPSRKVAAKKPAKKASRRK